MTFAPGDNPSIATLRQIPSKVSLKAGWTFKPLAVNMSINLGTTAREKK